MGKGDTRRPASVARDTLADNWARTFANAKPAPVCEHVWVYHPMPDAYLCSRCDAQPSRELRARIDRNRIAAAASRRLSPAFNPNPRAG